MAKTLRTETNADFTTKSTDLTPAEVDTNFLEVWARAKVSVAYVTQKAGEALPSRPNAEVVHYYSWDEPPVSGAFPYDQWFQIPEIIDFNVAPDAPTSTSVVGGDSEATVSWVASTSTGGAAPDGHRVYRNTANDFSASAKVGSDLGAGATTLTDTGVANDTEYFYWTTAFNSNGESAESNSASVTPTAVGVPDAFIVGDWGVADAESGDSITFTISSLPTANPSITDFEYRIDSGTAVSLGQSTTGAYTVSGLTEDASVNTQLRAVNSSGAGAWSDVKAVTPTLVVNAYADEVMADGPIAWWRFDETSGTTAADSVGTFTGTYLNTPTLNVTAPTGVGVLFDKAQEEGVSVSDNTALSFNNTAGMTLEAIVKIDSAGGTADRREIFRKGSRGDFDGDYEYLFRANSGSNSLRFGMARPDGTELQLDTSSITTDIFHHVVATWDGSVVKIYVDGVEAATTSETAGPRRSSSPVDLGIGLDLGSSGPREWFPGVIAEPAIYNKGLSAARVLAHAQAAGF